MSAMKMVKRTTVGSLALAVCLAGGGVALAGSASAAGFGFSRAAAGTDRYDSAVLASKAAFPDGDTSAKAVVIVNGDRPVDGLTATSLAGQMNAVVLYSGKDGVNDATRAEIKRLGVKTIVMVGGTSVLSQSMQDAIKGDGYSVTRVGGADRYETAAQVAKALVDAGATPTTAFVASGADANLVDSTTAAPVAYASRQPVLLTKPNEVPSATAASLKSLGIKNVLVLGGTSAVGDSVYSQLGGTKRVAGADRAETATQLADWAKDSAGFSRSDVALVGGDGSVTDSLAAAAFLGKKKVNLYYAGYAATDAYLMAHAADLTGQGYVFGGKAAVSDDAITKISAAVAASAPAGKSGANSTATAAPSMVSAVVNSATTIAVTMSGASALQNSTGSLSASDPTMISQFKYDRDGDGVTAVTSPTSVSVSGNIVTLTFAGGVLRDWAGSDKLKYTPSNIYAVTDGNIIGSSGKAMVAQQLGTIADGFAAAPSITAPTAPAYVIASASPNNRVTLTGLAEPGASVSVSGGSAVPTPVVADGSGNYSVNVSLTAENTFPLVVSQVDAAGNSGSGTASRSVLRDVTLPQIQTAALTTNTAGNNTSWDGIGDVLTLTFSEPIVTTLTNGQVLTLASQNQVRNLTSNSVTLDTNTTVTVNKTSTTITLTIGGQALSAGIATTDPVPGIANATVTDVPGNTMTTGTATL